MFQRGGFAGAEEPGKEDGGNGFRWRRFGVGCGEENRERSMTRPEGGRSLTVMVDLGDPGDAWSGERRNEAEHRSHLRYSYDHGRVD